MQKIIAILQLLCSVLLGLAAVATLNNLAHIITRPETISVVNTIIGQGVLIICLPALSRILFRKGLVNWRDLPNPAPERDG